MMSSLDTFLPYPTTKVARIKDCRLGVCRWCLLSAAWTYVLLYQILYRGNHLENMRLVGVHQTTLHHPTRRNCNSMSPECMQNFTSMSKLPYCKQSKDPWPFKLPCEYRDAAQLKHFTSEGVLLPTHIATFNQVHGCQPGSVNNWTCVGWLYDFVGKDGDVQTQRGQATAATDIFVADIEHYTLLIDHSVRAKFGHRHYAPDMVGYWKECSNRGHCSLHRIKCDHLHCPDGEKSLITQSLVSTRRDEVRSIQSRHGKRAEDIHPRRSAEKEATRARRGTWKEAVMLAQHEESTENEIVEFSEQDYDDEYDPDREVEDSGDVRDSTLDEDHDGASVLQIGTTIHQEVLRSQQTPVNTKERAINVNLEVEPCSIAQGDMFSIGSLLKTANVSLDARDHSFSDLIDDSYRSSGLVLVVRIHYSNIEPWLGLRTVPWRKMGPPLHYTISVTKHAPADDFVLQKVQRQDLEHDRKHSRVLKEYHGIRILVQQSGTICVWDNIQLLLILTATLALTAAGTLLTDTLALYCMSRSDEYWLIKYEDPQTKEKQNDGHRTSATEEVQDHVTDDR